MEDGVCGVVVVSTAMDGLVSSSSKTTASVLVARVVIGLLVGRERFVVTWGFFVVTPVSVVGFGLDVVSFVGRTGFSVADGFDGVGLLVGLFVVAGLFVVVSDGLAVATGLLIGFLVVATGRLVVVDGDANVVRL